VDWGGRRRAWVEWSREWRAVQRVARGADPRDAGERLRAANSEPSIAAFDLTFSAPKSVSVLFAVAPAEVSSALVECHEEAVRGALSYLEDEALFVRRGKGGVRSSTQGV